MLSPGREIGKNLQFLFLLPYAPSISRTMASFIRITPGKVHGGHKRRDDYTASRRAGKIHYCIAVSFDLLPAQRVSFDVLPTQRVYPWYSISDGLFFREITNLRRICGKFWCATITGPSSVRYHLPRTRWIKQGMKQNDNQWAISTSGLPWHRRNIQFLSFVS